jgi:hypothetical protein
MRLTKAILAVDDAEFYQQTAQIATNSWLNRIGLVPVVGFIGRNEPPRFDGAEIVRIAPLPDLPSVFQAQCLRLLLPVLFPDDVVITSDADMIPLSARYFHEAVSSVGEDKFVIYRPFDRIREGADGELHRTEIPICYNAASGRVWREVFGVDNVVGIRLRLSEWFERFRDIPEQLWSADQRLLHEHVARWDPEARRTVRLGDATTGHLRLHVADVAEAARPRRRHVVLPRSILRATDFHVESTVQRHLGLVAALLDYLDIRGSGVDDAAPQTNQPVDLTTAGSSMSTHIAPLVTAVVNTPGPVLELGAGDGSTGVLHSLCYLLGRDLVTADTSRFWLQRYSDLEAPWHRFEYVPVYEDDQGLNPKPQEWDRIGGDRRWGVVFVDHRPGERRVVDIRRLRSRAEVFVVHDTEEPSYGFYAILPQFRYTYTHVRHSTWTTVASDTVNVRAWFEAQTANPTPLGLVDTPAPPVRLGWILPNRRMLRAILRRHAPKLARRFRRAKRWL